jgi:hypothetical protein
MSDVINGAADQQIEENAEVKAEPVKEAGLIKDDLEARIDKVNKEWQSRFDKLLSEKKEKENQALTVEQRIEQVEREREAERLSFARERAKLGAKIDDELDAAIGLYRSSNPEEIGKGAESINAFFEKMKAAHEADKEAAIKEALAQAGAQPKPKGGSDTMTEITRESLKTPEGRRAMLEKAKVSGGAIPIVE